MTIINRIMELGGARNAGYERYLKTLPAFELAERLRILEAEATAQRESRGWRASKRGQLEMLPVIMTLGSAETSSTNIQNPEKLQASIINERGGGLPDLGRVLRESGAVVCK